MIRSIRVTLLFWYAVVLLGSMAVLGTVLHREMRSILYGEADAQLAHWAQVLRSALAQNGDNADTSRLTQAVRASLPEAAVFAVFDAAGRSRAASVGRGPPPPADEAGIVTRDDHRWLIEPDAAGGRLVVGRSVREENHGIRRFLIVLFGTGSLVVLLALGGGLLVVTRVLAPAQQIARTARSISATNLGVRIVLDRVPSELRGIVTALNESFARLDESFRAQTAFTADASHELRTPLAILRSHLELAGMAQHASEDLRERVVICLEAVERLEGIVRSLLTLARADSGQLPFDQNHIDLADLVESEVDALAPLAQPRGIEIVCHASPVTVRGDRDRLREVVSNLCDNAIRYNVDGGCVTVVVAREGEAAVLRVADTGIGIAEPHVGRVFERFFRADPARSRGGSGLGLAIVKWIVERHGGSVTATARPKEGTEFVVRLPIAGRQRPS